MVKKALSGLIRGLPLVLICVCLLWPAVSWSTQEHEFGEGPSNTGEVLLDRWQAEAALTWAEAQLAEDAHNPLWRFLRGQALFYAGRYQEAVTTFDALINVWPHPRFQGYRDFVAQTIQSTAKLQLMETAHFRIYMDPERDAALAPYVTDALEKSYQRLGKIFNFFPEKKILVELFPTPDTFYPASSLSAQDIQVSGAIGICKFNKIMLLSPRNLARGYRWMDALSHEYIHYILVHLSHNRAPIWLHEGMARYFEDSWRLPKPGWLTRRTESLLAHALAHDSFVGFKNMEPSLVKLETTYQVQLGYAEAASAIDFIVQRLGPDGLGRLLADLQQAPEGEGATDAIARVMGVAFDAFKTQWQAFLTEKKLQEHDGVRLPRFVLKVGDRIPPEDIREEIQSGAARNHSRLGDRLRQRGRIPAATMEYRRALGKDPYSPYLLNKLATALMLHGNWQKALPRLQQARQLDSDYVTTYTNLGRLYVSIQDYEQAIQTLSESVQLNPFDPEVHLLLAESYRKLGQTEKAQQEEQLFEQLRKRL